jgi:hypothetical protein
MQYVSGNRAMHFNVLAVWIKGGIRVNPNIVLIVMHIGRFGGTNINLHHFLKCRMSTMGRRGLKVPIL